MDGRLKSLDIFRGLTIALMILVNSQGNNTPYAPLAHSVWNGCTLTDLVFPFFIIIVGISSVLSLYQLKKKGVSDRILFHKIMKRSLYIFAIGLVLNILPNHFDWTTLRIPGVLQRIAICYFFASLLFLTINIRWQVLIFFMLLFVYWAILTAFSNTFPLTPEENLPGYLDALLLSSKHLYAAHLDPEGILSTLPAIASALLGNIIGYYLIVSSESKKKKLQNMILAGLILCVIGWLWSFTAPFNKALWTSSYVLWTGGLSLLAFSACFLLVDIKSWQSFWFNPFVFMGKNSLSIYVLHVLLLKIQSFIKIEDAQGNLVNLKRYFHDFLFGNFSMENAALAYALIFTILCYLLQLGQSSVHGKFRKRLSMAST